MKDGLTAETVADAWAIIIAEKRKETQEMQKVRALINTLLEPLKPWQQKAVVEGLYWYGSWRKATRFDGTAAHDG
jgi:hypothetical protein